jgi:tRNA(fMet)-specific endonuclease VapC
MSFLLDTDICSAHIKQRGGLTHRFIQHGGQLNVSVITAGELFTWASRRKASPCRLEAINHLFQSLTILDATVTISRKFGELRAALLDQGQPTPDLDLLIGATAIVHDLTLVTHIVQDFASVPGLRIDDWLAP